MSQRNKYNPCTISQLQPRVGVQEVVNQINVGWQLYDEIHHKLGFLIVYSYFLQS